MSDKNSPMRGAEPPPTPEAAIDRRVDSLDAYRGFTMLAMISAGLGTAALMKDPTWGWFAYQLEHVTWEGCTPWDMIQPSFMFIVGAAMPFAFAKRQEKGDTWGRQLGHAAVRALKLFAVGAMLDIYSNQKLEFGFIRVLQQIAFAYFVAFLTLRWNPVLQLTAALGLLAAHTLAFQSFTPTQPGPPYPEKLPEVWSAYAPHWMPRANFGSWFDEATIGINNKGGYSNFNAISSTATIIFGVVIGRLLGSRASTAVRVSVLLAATAVGLGVGFWLAGRFGELPAPLETIPSVKRLWTASFALIAAGWTCATVLVFHVLFDVVRLPKLQEVFAVVGANSIFAYCAAGVLTPVFKRVVTSLAGPQLARLGAWENVVIACVVLLMHWGLCRWLWNRRIFFKV